METLFLILFIVFATLFFLFEVVKPVILGLIIGKMIYFNHLVRKDKDHWKRECSDPNDYEQHIMWDKGIEWAKENKEFKKDVHIVSDGYNLYGEYYDFGFDKAVIIVPGRTESLCYSYFYAPSYKRAKVNVLLIDKRGHGESEGKYEDNGEHSYVDLIAWTKLLHDEYKMNDITYHGVCIGCSLCCFALASKDCPDYVRRFIPDGMYETFGLTFKKHMKKEKREIFPYLYTAMWFGKKYAHADFMHNGPIKQIEKVKVPTLFIYTDLDEFSTPDQAKRLYEKCTAKKELYWFHKGRHSHIRYHNEEEYDATIKRWVETN